jgi:hypothetical protein
MLAEFPKAFLDIKATKKLMLIGINGWPREVLKKMNKLRASEVILADLPEDERVPFMGHLFDWGRLVLVHGSGVRPGTMWALRCDYESWKRGLRNKKGSGEKNSLGPTPRTN